MSPMTPPEEYHAYAVWDAPTRWFHWINALAVLGLIILGVILLNGLAVDADTGRANGQCLGLEIDVGPPQPADLAATQPR